MIPYTPSISDLISMWLLHREAIAAKNKNKNNNSTDSNDTFGNSNTTTTTATTAPSPDLVLYGRQIGLSEVEILATRLQQLPNIRINLQYVTFTNSPAAQRFKEWIPTLHPHLEAIFMQSLGGSNHFPYVPDYVQLFGGGDDGNDNYNDDSTNININAVKECSLTWHNQPGLPLVLKQLSQLECLRLNSDSSNTTDDDNIYFTSHSAALIDTVNVRQVMEQIRQFDKLKNLDLKLACSNESLSIIVDTIQWLLFDNNNNNKGILEEFQLALLGPDITVVSLSTLARLLTFLPKSIRFSLNITNCVQLFSSALVTDNDHDHVAEGLVNSESDANVCNFMTALGQCQAMFQHLKLANVGMKPQHGVLLFQTLEQLGSNNALNNVSNNNKHNNNDNHIHDNLNIHLPHGRQPCSRLKNVQIHQNGIFAVQSNMVDAVNTTTLSLPCPAMDQLIASLPRIVGTTELTIYDDLGEYPETMAMIQNPVQKQEWSKRLLAALAKNPCLRSLVVDVDDGYSFSGESAVAAQAQDIFARNKALDMVQQLLLLSAESSSSPASPVTNASLLQSQADAGQRTTSSSLTLASLPSATILLKNTHVWTALADQASSYRADVLYLMLNCVAHELFWEQQ